MNKYCEVCNRPLKERQKRFCSKSCANKYWSDHYKKARQSSLTEIACKVCGKLFHPVRKGQLYCSDTCRWRSNSNWNTWYKKTCLWCHQEFKTKMIKQKYCINCGQYRSKGHKRISPLLRRTIWTRQEGNCFLCQQPVKFDDAITHHLDGDGQKDSPNNSVENLVVLHKLCHKQFHQLFLNYKDGRWYITGDVLDILGLQVEVKKASS